MENDGSEGVNALYRSYVCPLSEPSQVDVLWSTLSEADVEAVTKLETLVPGTIFADRSATT